MKKKIFLSGPMKGISRKQGMGWRTKATKLLSDKFVVRHAYRGREKQETFSDPRSAVIRDKYDIIHSDIVLVNDTMKDVSMIGTSMEVLLAYENNIPVILFGDAHKGDYFLDYHSHARLPSLKEACKLINKMFFD